MTGDFRAIERPGGRLLDGPQHSVAAGAPLQSGAWHSALRSYLAVIGVGNLAWEFAQMPLYTLWQTGTWSEIAFAAAHCTGGDVLIALSSLTIAILAVGTGQWPLHRFGAVAAVTIVLGVGYTVLSEYLNIVIRAAWAYSHLMPVVSLSGFRIGLSPLLQWIVIPIAAFALAGRAAERTKLTGATSTHVSADDSWADLR